MNSLWDAEQLSSGAGALRSNGSSCAPRLVLRLAPSSLCPTAGVFPVPLSLLFRNSLCGALTRRPPSSLFFQPPPTRQFIHLWLESSSGAVWSGARWAGGLPSWALDGPVPPILAWPPVRAHRLQKWCCYQVWVDKQQFAVTGAPKGSFIWKQICLYSTVKSI